MNKSKDEKANMQRQGTKLSFMSTSSSDDIDPDAILPADYDLPSTHVVQVLNSRYLRTPILMEALDAAFGKDNWGLVVSILCLDLFLLCMYSSRLEGW